MQTKAGVGYSALPNSKAAGVQAAQQALDRANTKECNLVLLFSTSKHDPKELRDGVRSVVGDQAKLAGGFSVGVITNDQLSYGGYEVAVAVISSPTIQTDLFVEGGIEEDSFGAGKRLGEKIRNATYEGDPNLLVMFDCVKGAQGGMTNMSTPILQGMESSLVKWPRAAGLGFLGDLKFYPTSQWVNDEIYTKSVMGLVLHGKTLRMDTIVMHGCRPSSDYQKITKADGNVILELNGKPALDKISELLGPDSDKSWEDYPLWVTFGMNKGDRSNYNEDYYVNRMVMALDKDRKGLVMGEPDFEVGMEIQLMRRSVRTDYVHDRVKKIMSELDGRKPFMAIYINCVGRASLYCGMETEDAAEVQKAFKDIPLIGMYSGQELAMVAGKLNAFNWSGVLCLLSE